MDTQWRDQIRDTVIFVSEAHQTYELAECAEHCVFPLAKTIVEEKIVEMGRLSPTSDDAIPVDGIFLSEAFGSFLKAARQRPKVIKLDPILLGNIYCTIARLKIEEKGFPWRIGVRNLP